MSYPISFVTAKTISTKLENRYTFCKNRKHHWLQRLAIKILDRLGCNVFGEELVYERHTIDTDKLLTSIHVQQHELLSLYHRRGERLLIGPRQYADLLSQSFSAYGPISFDVPYQWATSYTDPTGYTTRDIKVLGLHVTIVPWMDGMLVVPKDLA